MGLAVVTMRDGNSSHNAMILFFQGKFSRCVCVCDAREMDVGVSDTTTTTTTIDLIPIVIDAPHVLPAVSHDGGHQFSAGLWSPASFGSSL